MHTACSEGRLNIVEAILEEEDCRLEVKDDGGCTPLWRAVQNEKRDVVEVLL